MRSQLLILILLLIVQIGNGQTVTPIFTTPDTVCVNTPVTINNTTIGASNYFWNFCVASTNTTPIAQNLGNPGGLLAEPVFSDIIDDNGHFYAFVVNHLPGGLVRLDFGNSMLNTPIPFYLGNPDGAMNATNGGNEGIQVIKNEGKWYAIIVGGNSTFYGPLWPRIVKIEFGTNIANNTPSGTNWGNLGNLNEPIDLHMFQDNGIWYGFTVNAETNTITRFNFTNSFDNIPTGVNLGNIGNLNYPTGIYAINDNGFYRVFIGNGGSSTLTRLDFGNSLLNIPVGINLGNPGNVLSTPRDMTILRLCGEIVGFAVNQSNELTRFDFHNDLSSPPFSGSSYGNTGNLNFPHSLSKLFRVGNDLYTLITNVNNNTITRLQFAGCTAASIASSSLQNPPAVIYNTPGTYNINLSVDEGLPTQNAFCKQVVVIPELVHIPTQRIVSCNSTTKKIGTGVKQASYVWNTGETTDSIITTAAGIYWVDISRFGCAKRDSFSVVTENVAVKTNNDTTVCAGKQVQLQASGTGLSYSWSPVTDLSNPAIANPIASPLATTQYVVTTTGSNGCTALDTIIISMANPASCLIAPIVPDFTNPDTVCVNTPFNIVNKTVGAATNYWNFCVADLKAPPTATNLGNIGGNFSQATFLDYVFTNNNYYGFTTNYLNGNLIRLDFGNSLLNTPVAVNLGNFPGMLTPLNIVSEGIQIVFNEGRWYAIIVGGADPGGNQPRIFKVDFGASITNPNPVATDWGNIGNMYQPLDLHVFKDGINWYGFTVNSENNTITRFSFSNSFNNTPTAVNLGNIGNLSYPTGIYAINDNGFWRVFVTNGGNNTTVSGNFSLTRLDFGSSLLNTPTGINLGNTGNKLAHPRDLTIIRSCGQTIGFLTNGHPNFNDIVRLDFNSDLSSTPIAQSLGNIGSLNFPVSISKLFRVNDELYSFIVNSSVGGSSLTRVRFAGCTNASISSSTLQNPPSITYNAPGTYNINLSVDDGLPTQNAYCKQVVVMPLPVHTPLQKIALCNIDSIKIGTGLKQVSYLWNTGATTDSIYVKNNDTYWVKASTASGCSNVDSFTVNIERLAVKTNNDTAICSGKTVQLNTVGTAVSYSWTPATGLSSTTIANPVATPIINSQYTVTGTGSSGCIVKDTVSISVNPSPVIVKTSDTTICHDKTIQLNAGGGNVYAWLPDATLSNTSIPNPVASPVTNSTYYITVTNTSNCSSLDSIKILVRPATIFGISPDISACKGSPVHLNAAGGNSYSWQPADGLDNPSMANPVATPDITTVYTVKIIENTCKDSASLSARLTILPLPIVKANSTNDVDCTKPVSQLNASGGIKYVWQPAPSLNDSAIAAPFASPSATTLYTVKGTDVNGCYNYDSVKVVATKIGDLLVNIPNAFTPNSDNKNECFGISRYAGLLKNVDFSVYDRFGVRVFHTTNALNCWDGRYKGKLQDANGFVYILKASTFCGEIFKKGIVMLIK